MYETTENKKNNLTVERLLQYGRRATVWDLCLPRSLGKIDLDRIEAINGRSIHLSANETLYRQGTQLNAIYFVASGLMKNTITGDIKGEQITGFYFPFELFGLDALHTNEHICTATAITPSVVHPIPLVRLHAIEERFPPLQRALEALFSQNLAEHEELLLVVNQRPAVERVAILLFSLSCRLSHDDAPILDVPLQMSRDDIANYLGLASETVSRATTTLFRSGLLAGPPKKPHIVDLPGLTQVVLGSRSFPPD